MQKLWGNFGEYLQDSVDNGARQTNLKLFNKYSKTYDITSQFGLQLHGIESAMQSALHEKFDLKS